MSDQDAFERIMASLSDAMLDETQWPATSALIDEACGAKGNAILVSEGPKDDVRSLFIGLYYRGQRREDLEREYLDQLLPHRRKHTALTGTARQPAGAHHRVVHGRGAEDLAHLQRVIGPGQRPAWLARAPGRAGWLLCHLGHR